MRHLEIVAPSRFLTPVTRAYGLGTMRARYLGKSENWTWRIAAADNVYLLRCHRPAVEEIACLPVSGPDGIREELEWLRELAPEVSFPVPAPITSREGNLVYTIATQTGLKLHWSMLRWIPGRRLRRRVLPMHLRLAGRTMAELHRHSRRNRPECAERPRWDIERLHRAIEELEPLREEGILDESHWDFIRRIVDRSGVLLSRLFSDPASHGLIHADLGPNNLLFGGGRATPIDFSSCGLGSYAYDMAQCLFAAPRMEYWTSFFKGYEEIQTIASSERRDARQLTGMAYVYWLNYNASSRLRNIAPRIDPTRRRVAEQMTCRM